LAYSIQVSGSTLTVTIRNSYAADYFRIFVRYADDTSSRVHDEFVEAPAAASFTYEVTGLDPGDYTMNVGYNDTGSGNVTWIGAKNFTIVDDTPDPP